MESVQNAEGSGMDERQAQNEAKAREVAEEKTLRPTGNRILVRRKDADEKSPGGIIIPEQAKEKPAEGTIVAVGEGTYVQGTNILRPVGVKAGEEILFGKYAGTEIKLSGVDHVIIMEDDVLGVLEKRNKAG